MLVKQVLGKDAFYFSFDEKKYANPESLKQAVEVFIGEKEKPVIFLDEVFRVEDWAGVLKKYHDQKRARFVVSGSSSLLIKKGIESLSGRLFTYYLPPLHFDDIPLTFRIEHPSKLYDLLKLKSEGELSEETKKILKLPESRSGRERE